MPSKVPKCLAPSNNIPPQDDNLEERPSGDLVLSDNLPP
jgi:hypothetical protein